jgi:hypothetical protein
MVPCILTCNVWMNDFLRLLEVQQTEHVLMDIVSCKPTTSSNISRHYHSQLLMVTHLQHAMLEVDLYATAIAKDGLCLLEGATQLGCTMCSC